VFKAFFGSKKWAIWAWGGGILVCLLIEVNVMLTVELVEWRGDFFKMLQDVSSYDLKDFWTGIGEFTKIALELVFLGMFSAYFARIYSFHWREAITFAHVRRWREVEQDVEGSSQRIQEDFMRFAIIVESLGSQVVKAFLTLISFLPILWAASADLNLSWFNSINGLIVRTADSWQIPFLSVFAEGSMVWLALFISIGGLVISWLVGIKLPILEYNNQIVEAAFRKELVFAEDNKISFAQPPTIIGLFTGLESNYYRLFRHTAYFDVWIYTFDRVMMITPYLLMAPGLFAGVINLGILIKVSSAFGQVRASFSVFTARWTVITELRSIFRRIREFERNIGY
jgi:peptide/bleomycin uptake transporter